MNSPATGILALRDVSKNLTGHQRLVLILNILSIPVNFVLFEGVTL